MKKMWVVKYTKKCKCECVVNAENEIEARKAFESGETEDEVEIDTWDHEIISVVKE